MRKHEIVSETARWLGTRGVAVAEQKRLLADALRVADTPGALAESILYRCLDAVFHAGAERGRL